MTYLPFENIIYKTKLSEREIQNRLNEIVGPEKWFRFHLFTGEKIKPYEGTVTDTGFKILRIIDYRNSFLPVITGTIRRSGSSCEVHVKMRPHIIVMVFLTAWCSGVLAAAAICFALMFTEGFAPIGFIPLGMVAFCYALTMIGFKTESAKSKKYFAQLFDAEKTPQPTFKKHNHDLSAV